MNIQWLCCKALCRLAHPILLFSMLHSAHAQTPPTPGDFDRDLKTCALTQSINLPDIIDSVGKLYAGENSKQILRSSTQFLTLIPDNMKLEAYRLYADCIMKTAPQLAATSSPPASTPSNGSPPATAITAPPPVVVPYKICSGEYERACQPHDVYLYCGDSAEAWAKKRCTSYSLTRLNTYGGNKCGYSLDQVICTGPK
jgi:hypothetical protein